MILLPPGFDHLLFMQDLLGVAWPFLLVGFALVCFKIIKRILNKV